MTIRSMPPASSHLAERPVPAPPPTIGSPRANQRLIRLPHHVNDEAFADALVAAWREIEPKNQETAHAAHR